jgi:hypothetical protein
MDRWAARVAVGRKICARGEPPARIRRAGGAAVRAYIQGQRPNPPETRP